MLQPRFSLITSVLLAVLITPCYGAGKLPITFTPDSVRNVLDNATKVVINTTDCSIFDEDLRVVAITGEKLIEVDEHPIQNFGNKTNCWSAFEVTGIIIGKASVRIESLTSDRVSDELSVIIIREKQVIDDVFVYSVAILVSIIYINFGCALDWQVLKKTVKRPIGPCIGFFCQFVIMPLVAFGLGKWIFPDSPEMQLGLFFTGLSPAGGASNIWSVALEANVNLSITMTTISTICAFGMFPFWLFTLGDQIFSEADMATPYSKVSEYVVTLVIPLAFGLLSQKYLPKFAKFMVWLLKPFSLLLIIFIIVFASITNTYLFDLFTWKIAAAGIGLPWLGYFGGFLAALACRQPMKDVLAIAVETGVQNTGIAIFMLRFSLDDPAADLTTVIPVSVSIMTPIPLLCLYIFLKGRKCYLGTSDSDKADIVAGNDIEEQDNESKTNEITGIVFKEILDNYDNL